MLRAGQRMVRADDGMRGVVEDIDLLAAGGVREVNAKIALPAPTAASMPGAPEYPSKEVE